LIILAAVKTNARNTGRTDVLGKSDYLVNKMQCDILLEQWIHIYLVQMVEFQPEGDL
jgi:hypothetical protein